MRIPLVKKVVVSVFNILFPPFAVAALTGFTSKDTFVNCCLFCLAVFPAHIHGAIISWTYFRRKRKVRKNRFPGEERAYIFSEKVQTGGAGWRRWDQLRRDARYQNSNYRKRISSRPDSYIEDPYGKDFEVEYAEYPSRQTTRSNRMSGASPGLTPIPSRHSTRRKRSSKAYY